MQVVSSLGAVSRFFLHSASLHRCLLAVAVLASVVCMEIPGFPRQQKKVRHSVASLPGHPNVSDEQAHSLPFPPRQKLIIPIVWYFFRRFSLTCCKLAWVCGSPFKSKCTPATDSTLVNNPQPSFQHSLQSVNAIIEPTFNIKGSNNLTHQINT